MTSPAPVDRGLTEQRIAEITAVAADARRKWHTVGAQAIDDLLAEVRRLKAENGRLTTGLEEVNAKFEEFIGTLPTHVQSQIRSEASRG